jgi:hypothetical protein
MSDVICKECGQRLVDDAHMKLLQKMRARIQNAIFEEDCPPRDLAALTRRLQDISREINELEERQRREGGSDGSTGSTAADDWDPANI